MLTKLDKATFKCKDCGETFETFYTEGGIRAGINLPHCPKCGSGNTRNKGFYSIVALVGLILTISFSSCATPREIKEHIKTDNISELIADHNGQKPKNQRKIEDYIFNSHDFSKDSYGNLKAYRDKSTQDNMQSQLSVIINAREKSILAVLDSFENIKSIAAYYRGHFDEQSFLNPIIAGTLTQNISDYEYKDVRVIYREFRNTDIADSIYPYYAEKRELALPLAIASVEKYLKSELKLFDIYKAEGKDYIPQIASKAFEQLIDQLLDCDLSKNTPQLKEQYNRITSRNNPITAIKNVVKDEAQKMMKDMNECRSEIVKELIDAKFSSRYEIPTLPISVKKRNVKYPSSELNTIASVYQRPNPQSTINTVLSIASWLPGFIGTVATAANIYKTYKDTKKQATEVSPYIKKMATVVFNNFKATCTQEYNESYEKLREPILESQKQLKQAIYEDF